MRKSCETVQGDHQEIKMKKWYKESYFDRKNWILENFDKLNLNADETILILLIDLCKTSRKAITYEHLTGKHAHTIEN